MAMAACEPSQLTVGGIGASPAAGTGIVTVRATNISTSKCSIKGVPRVSFIEPVGSAIPVRIAHSGPGPAFGAPKPVLLVPGAKAGFVITSADDMDPKFACRTAAALKVALPGNAGSATVPTAKGPSQYLMCAVPPALPLVHVSSLVPASTADSYAPESDERTLPQPTATSTEVAQFVARATTGFHGPISLVYSTLTDGAGAEPGTLSAAIASATRWAYQASPSLFSIRSEGTSAAVYMDPTNERPGLYSCVRAAPRRAWNCASDADAAMGGRAELFGPSPQVALLEGLGNAVTTYQARRPSARRCAPSFLTSSIRGPGPTRSPASYSERSGARPRLCA